MPTEFKTIRKVCKKCGVNFEWTAGEQKFMYKLLSEEKIQEVREPGYCPMCRADRKKEREARGM